MVIGLFDIGLFFLGGFCLMDNGYFVSETVTDEITAENEHAGRDGKCRPHPEYIKVCRLARAYVPMQQMCDIFCAEKSLKHGTVFPELFMPYDSDEKWRR